MATLDHQAPQQHPPHVRVMGQLVEMLHQGTLRHASLWVGAEGIGKARWAAWLAKKALCLSEAADDCQCASCSKSADHPDLLVLGIEPDSLKIDAVRELIGRCQLRPLVSPRRVVIIHSAHSLTPQAQNALLKTLEEPPGGTIFILLTHRERFLLPTIRSRCQIVRFAPLTSATDQPPLVEGVEPLAQLLRAPLKKRLEAAEKLGKDHDLTMQAARRFAVDLRRFATEGQPAQRAKAHRLFLDLSDLLRASEGYGNRRLLWERWFLSAEAGA